MDRERAEPYIRRLAEEELRRSAAPCSDGSSWDPPEDGAVRPAGGSGTRGGRAAGPAGRHRAVPGSGPQQALPGWPAGSAARVARVAWALTAVGALDGEVAGQVLEDFELALAIRQDGSPVRCGPGLGSWRRPSPRRPRSVAGSGSGAGPAAAPARVVRLGQVVPVRGEDVGGEAYLLSYAQTASGPQLNLVTIPLVQAWPLPSRLEQFTATDDRGTSYQMTVRDLGGGPDG
jgi:hypothetical protein